MFSYFLDHRFDVNILGQHFLSNLALSVFSRFGQVQVLKEQIKYEFVSIRAFSILKVFDQQVSYMFSLVVSRQVSRIVMD